MNPARRAELNDAMVRLADGDRGAMGVVYGALQEPVRALCRRVLRDDASSDDVVQQALMRVFRQAAQFDRDGDALAWALSIAYWACRSELQRRQRAWARSSALPVEHVLSGDNSSERFELRELLEKMFHELSTEECGLLARSIEGEQLDAAHRKRKQRLFEKLRRFWAREVTDG